MFCMEHFTVRHQYMENDEKYISNLKAFKMFAGWMERIKKGGNQGGGM